MVNKCRTMVNMCNAMVNRCSDMVKVTVHVGKNPNIEIEIFLLENSLPDS